MDNNEPRPVSGWSKYCSVTSITGRRKLSGSRTLNWYGTATVQWERSHHSCWVQKHDANTAEEDDGQNMLQSIFIHADQRLAWSHTPDTSHWLQCRIKTATATAGSDCHAQWNPGAKLDPYVGTISRVAIQSIECKRVLEQTYCQSLCLSVCQSGEWIVEQMTDWMWVPLEVVSESVEGGVYQMGTGSGGRRRERGSLGVNVGHPIVTNGDFVA